MEVTVKQQKHFNKVKMKFPEAQKSESEIIQEHFSRSINESEIR